MAFSVKYRTEFSSISGNDIRIDIEQDGYGGSVTYLTSLGGSLSYPDGDKSKLSDVKISELSFGVLIQVPEDLQPLTDTYYKVKLYIDGVINWVGWVVSGGLSYSLNDGLKQVTVVAKDGLHLLSEDSLTDLSGGKPYLFYRLSTLVAFCLAKTELGLNFKTWIKIYQFGDSERDATADPTGERDPFYTTFVSGRTFQQGESDYEDSLSVLQKICSSFKMFMFQARGEWHLLFLEDLMRTDGISCTIYDADGVPFDILLDQNFDINIGLSEYVKFANDDTRIDFQQAYKHVKVKHSFDVPNSLIRNIDLREGTFIDYQTGGIRARYTLDGFTETTDSVGGTQSYIFADLYELNQRQSEKYRYINFGDLTAAGKFRQIATTPSPCNENDLFEFSFIFQVPSGTGVNYYCDIQITDSTFPFATKWLGADGKWKNSRNYVRFYNNATPSTNFSITTVERIPFTGSLQIFFRIDANASAFGPKIWGFNYDYKPTISNNRTIADGVIYESYSEKDKTIFNDELPICDALSIVTKGALTDFSTILAKDWYHEGTTEQIRFGRLICRILWKFLYRTYYRIEGNLLRYMDGGYLLSPLNTFYPLALPNRKFILSTLTIDLRTEQSEATFVEVIKIETTDDYDEIAANENYFFISPNQDDRFKVPRVQRFKNYAQYGAFGAIVWAINNRRNKTNL